MSASAATLSDVASSAAAGTGAREAPLGTYNYKVVRQFAVMTMVWAIVGMAVGVLLAAQLVWPVLNFDIPYLTYSRLRPLHTNAVIFAFGGSALMATSYYIVQRTCHVRLISDKAAAFTFWGWQAVIVSAAITLPPRYHDDEGVRRTRVANRPADRRGLADLRLRLHRHHHEAPGAAHLRGQLVLWRVHRHRRDAARGQQRRAAGQPVQVVLAVCGHAGCNGAVVVRAQCCRLLPDRRFPRHDVLLRAKAGRAADLLLPAVHRALLGARLRPTCGRVHTTCTTPPCRTGRSHSAWCFR